MSLPAITLNTISHYIIALGLLEQWQVKNIFVQYNDSQSMRSTKQEIQRLRIKSELGQRILEYQQNKTSEKAEEDKRKLKMKQQIMEDILKKKYNPKPPSPPSKTEQKIDSKLYSFGFSNPQSYMDQEVSNQQSYVSQEKPNYTSRGEEESSLGYAKTMGNKYLNSEDDNKWNHKIQNSYLNDLRKSKHHEDEPHQQKYDDQDDQERYEKEAYQQDQAQQSQQISNPSSVDYIDHEIPQNNFKIPENKSRFTQSKSSHFLDLKSNQYSDFSSFGRKNNPINLISAQQLREKSKQKQKQKVQGLSYSKFTESISENKSGYNFGKTRPTKQFSGQYQQSSEDLSRHPDMQNPPIINEIDQIASQLSKQYLKNNSSDIKNNFSDLKSNNSQIKNNSSLKILQKSERQMNAFDKMILPPKPQKEKRIQKIEQHNLYLTETPESPQQLQKAYGGFIKEGQANEDYLQQLRKKKIKQLEQKRKQRSQERKKSQQISQRQEKTLNEQNQKKQMYSNLHKKEKQHRKTQQYYPNDHSSYLPPPLPDKKYINNKSRTSSEAEHTRSSGFDKNSQRKSSPKETSSIQSSSSKGLLKTPKSSIFQSSPNRPKDKSLSKLFQDPKIEPKQRKQTFNKQSNKKMMMNAINNVCLPGQINRKQRQRLLQVLQNDSSEYFIFLFKQYSRNVIKAVYTYDSISGSVFKIYGDKAPSEVHAQDVLKFYRFDSGAKQFRVLDGCKSFSYAVHAIYIK